MGRKSRHNDAPTSSMRISVQKYIDQKAVEDHQKRLVQQQQREARLQQRHRVVAAPVDESQPSTSGHRNDEKPRSAPVPVPERLSDTEAGGSSRSRAENVEHQAQHQRNRDEIPDVPILVVPPAVVAAAAPERVAVRKKEPLSKNHRMNDLQESAKSAPIVGLARYDNQNGVRRFCGESYALELSQMLLPNRKEGVLERLERLVEGELRKDFELISRDGRSFPCNKQLLQNMLMCIDISKCWKVSKMDLDASQNTVRKVVEFTATGRITVDDRCFNELMEVGDFLGFETLLKVCSAYASRQSFRIKSVVGVHLRFPHVDGIQELFTARLDRMPIHLFYPKLTPDETLLTCLNFDQLQKVLARDSLVVNKEDHAVTMIVDWSRHHNASEEQKQMLLSHIRYPFLSKAMSKSLTDGSLGLPAPKSEYLTCETNNRARTGHDHHVHLLFSERCEDDKGPVDMAVSCVTWNDQFKNFQHKIVCKTGHVRNRWEDTTSAEYGVVNGQMYKATLNRDHDEIDVAEVNLLAGTATDRYTIPLAEERIVENSDPIFVTGSPLIKIAWWDRGRGIACLDQRTWERIEMPPLERFPVTPLGMRIDKDYAIAYTCRSLVISDPDFYNAVNVELPETNGDYTDYRRIGNLVFLLEDNSQIRVANKNKVDRVHRIDVESKKLLNTVRLPRFPEPNWHDSYYPHYPRSSLRFFTENDKLFILTRIDRDLPHRIYSFDTETFECKFIGLVPAAQKIQKWLNQPPSTVVRRFYTTVPIQLTPCDRMTLKDMGESFKIPESE